MSTKTVIITGGSRGIGRSLAVAYARKGFNVSICAIHNESLQVARQMVEREGASCLAVPCDVRNAPDVAHFVEQTRAAFGTIDVAILNAGIARATDVIELDLEVYRLVMETNFFGVLNAIKAVMPVMQAQGGGTIACISSLTDARPVPRASPYVASKAALSAMLEAASIEAAASNVNVLSIRPGFISTDMTAANTYPMPFLLSTDEAAMKIIRAIEKPVYRMSFPLPTYLLSELLRAMPYKLWRWMFASGLIK